MIPRFDQGRVMALAMAVALALGAGAHAGEGTFKRVKVPAPGTKRLINIQIEPVAPVERVLPVKPDVPAAPPKPKLPGGKAPGSDTMAWFWAELSPDLNAASTTRMGKAVGLLDLRTQDLARIDASPQMLDRILNDHGVEILKATAGTQVSPALVLSVIAVESAGKPAAKSSAGAVGLMQLMPATARRFGVTDRTDPGQSIRGGTAYLEFLLNEFGGDPLLALAGYNAGEGAVLRNGGVPAYAETRAYVPKVIAAWRHARMMCMQPPVRASDGCLFSGMKVALQ